MLSCITVHFMKSKLAFCQLTLSYPSHLPTLLVFLSSADRGCPYNEVLITPLLIQISQPSFLFCSLVFKFKLPGSVCLPAPHSPSITLASQPPPWLLLIRGSSGCCSCFKNPYIQLCLQSFCDRPHGKKWCCETNI